MESCRSLPFQSNMVHLMLYESILVYDDGIVKGLIRIEKSEIVELYVDYFFQNQGIGSSLIEFAKNNYPITFALDA